MNQELFIITGANRGIGRGITKALANGNNHIIMACRDIKRSIASAEQIRAESGNRNIELLEMDLSSFKSIYSFVNAVQEKKTEIALLINNAGVLCNTFQRTVDGYERTTATNYIGHFLLTCLLLPMMSEGNGQIINISSIMYRSGKVDDSFFSYNEDSYHGFQAYADSKLALLLFSLELAERLRVKGISVNSTDPGIVNTNILTMNKWFDPLTDILFRPFVKTAEKGAETIIYLVEKNNDERSTGKYYIRKKERKLPDRIMYHPYKKKLWEKTEKILGF